MSSATPLLSRPSLDLVQVKLENMERDETVLSPSIKGRYLPTAVV